MPAAAQSISKIDSGKLSPIDDGNIRAVTDRAYPDLHRAKEEQDEAEGLRLGTFTVEPQLEISGIWSSNAKRSPNDTDADFGASLKPSLTFKSDWPRHEVNGKISGDTTRFIETNEAEVNAFDADLNARIDIRRDTRLEVNSGYELASTRAGSGEVPGAAVGSRSDQTYSAGVALTHEMGRLQLRGGVDFDYNTFGDVDLAGGGVENNDDRDLFDIKSSLRVGYDNDGALSPFVRLNYSPRIYPKSRDRNAIKRSSQGYGIDVGVAFDNDAIWSGEIAASYALRDPAEASFKNEDLIGINGEVTWRPLETSQVTLAVSSSLGETLANSQSANQNWSAALNYEHAVTEFITWNAGAKLDAADTSTGLEKTYGVSSAVNWEINRYVAWSLGYEGSWFDAKTSPSRDFNEQRLLTSIILSH